MTIPIASALRILGNVRGPDDILVTNQVSARLWPKINHHPLDFHYNPSAMGGAIPLALGLALARPDRHVLCLTGDGSLLMNLGCLVSVIDSGVSNLSIVLLDNAMYEVTGGQKTPATRSRPDYSGLARSAGFPSVATVEQLEDWQLQAASFFQQPGPRFAWLRVSPASPKELTGPSLSMSDQLARLKSQLCHPVPTAK